MSVEDALAIRNFVGPSQVGISPAGGHVCYTVDEAARRKPSEGSHYEPFMRTGVSSNIGECSAWVADVATGETICLGEGGASSWAPVWSPDGASVAFYSSRSGVAQIWLWDQATKATRRVSDRIPRPYFPFERVRWTPDGKRLLAKVLPEGISVEQANAWQSKASPEPRPTTECTAVEVGSTVKEAVEEPCAGAPKNSSFFADLVMLDVATGSSISVATGVQPLWFEISPDGSQVAFTEYMDVKTDSEGEHLYRLVVVSLEDGRETFSASDLKFFLAITVSWSPDSRKLACTASGECRIFDVGGKTTTVVSADDGDFGTMCQPPYWSPDSHSFLVSRGHELWSVVCADATASRVPLPDHLQVAGVFAGGQSAFWTTDGGNSVVISAREAETDQGALYRVDLRSGGCEKLPVEDVAAVGSVSFRMDVTPDGTKCAYVVEDVAHPGELWVSDSAFAAPQRATNPNPQLEGITMGRSRIVEWVSTAGDALRGALLLPANYDEGRRNPVIVAVCTNRPTYGFVRRYALLGNPGLEFTDPQLLATRGYAVFAPEIRATGLKMMEGHIACVLPGIDKLVEMGIADPDRLGVIGQSIGGFGVLSLISSTTRFRAAVASASLSDWVAMATHSDAGGGAFWHDYVRRHLGAGIWEDRDRYIANSPLYSFDRVETPVLLIQGGLDPATSPQFADQSYIALKALGKEVCYVRYDGEQHWHGAWGYANRLDYTNRVIAWFDRYLGGDGGSR